jgi:hypothetical protein
MRQCGAAALKFGRIQGDLMIEHPQPAAPCAAGFLPPDDTAPRPQEPDVSIVGVMLLSLFSVGMAVLGMLFLGLIVMGMWWLVSHIPVPTFVWRVLTHLGII